MFNDRCFGFKSVCAIYNVVMEQNKKKRHQQLVLVISVFCYIWCANNDDATRGLLAALISLRKKRGFGIKFYIAVTSGSVYSGLLVSSTEREYGVLGMCLLVYKIMFKFDDIFIFLIQIGYAYIQHKYCQNVLSLHLQLYQLPLQQYQQHFQQHRQL